MLLGQTCCPAMCFLNLGSEVKGKCVPSWEEPTNCQHSLRDVKLETDTTLVGHQIQIFFCKYTPSENVLQAL